MVENFAEYLNIALQVLLAAHGLALVIVNLTPTPTDDTFVATVYSWIEKLAGLVLPKSKQ